MRFSPLLQNIIIDLAWKSIKDPSHAPKNRKVRQTKSGSWQYETIPRKRRVQREDRSNKVNITYLNKTYTIRSPQKVNKTNIIKDTRKISNQVSEKWGIKYPVPSTSYIINIRGNDYRVDEFDNMDISIGSIEDTRAFIDNHMSELKKRYNVDEKVTSRDFEAAYRLQSSLDAGKENKKLLVWDKDNLISAAAIHHNTLRYVGSLVQGKGLGSFMLDRLQEIGSESGAEFVYIEDAEEDSVNFYAKNGFAISTSDMYDEEEGPRGLTDRDIDPQFKNMYAPVIGKKINPDDRRIQKYARNLHYAFNPRQYESESKNIYLEGAFEYLDKNISSDDLESRIEGIAYTISSLDGIIYSRTNLKIGINENDNHKLIRELIKRSITSDKSNLEVYMQIKPIIKRINDDTDFAARLSKTMGIEAPHRKPPASSPMGGNRFPPISTNRHTERRNISRM